MLKITGGIYRSRRINAPKGRHTRPTAEKVRESLFNVLAHMHPLQGLQVVDLFAGSGALGIESLSRGAAHVTFVESHAPTAGLIRGNLKALEIPRELWRVEVAHAEKWCQRPETDVAPQVILADPPYAGELAAQTLAAIALNPTLPEGISIVMECAHRNPPILPGNLELLQVKSYGDTDVIFCRKLNQETEQTHNGEDL